MARALLLPPGSVGPGGRPVEAVVRRILVGTVVQVAMGGKQHLCPFSGLSQDVCLAFFGHPMSHSFSLGLLPLKGGHVKSVAITADRIPRTVFVVLHIAAAELVRDVCTVLGFGQLGRRTARPGPLPRHRRPGQADSTSGNGERQITAPQPKPRGRSTGTSELAVQIKCVRTQMAQCDGADGDTESLQNELIRLEKRKASGQSCADVLAVQLRDFNMCESKISVTFAEIAWLRKVRCGKEEDLQKQQKKKSEVEFAKWELAKMRVNIVDAKTQVRAAGWTAVFSAARPGRGVWGPVCGGVAIMAKPPSRLKGTGTQKSGPEWTGTWLAATVGGVGGPLLVCTVYGHVNENGCRCNLQLLRHSVELRAVSVLSRLTALKGLPEPRGGPSVRGG